MKSDKTEDSSSTNENGDLDSHLGSTPAVSTPKIRTSIGWLFVSSAISRPLQLAQSIVLARVLGPVVFGESAILNSAATTLAGIGAFGLGEAIHKVVAERSSKEREIGISISMTVILGCLAFLSLAGVFLWFERDIWMVFLLKENFSPLTSFLVILLGISNASGTLLKNSLVGLSAFRSLALFEPILIFSSALSSIALGCWMGANGILIAAILTSIFSSGIYIIQLKAACGNATIRPRALHTKEIKEISSYAIPSFVWALISGPLSTMSLALLVANASDLNDTGLFNAANGLRNVVAIIPSLVLTAFYPAIIQAGGRFGSWDELSSLLTSAYRICLLLLIPALIFLIFGADLVSFAYGKDYGNAVILFPPLVLAASLATLSQPANIAMVSRNFFKTNLSIGLFQYISQYVFGVILVPKYGPIGLAWSFLASQLIAAVVQFELGVYLRCIPAELRIKHYVGFFVMLGIFFISLLIPHAYHTFLLVLSPIAFFASIRYDANLRDWYRKHPLLQNPVLQSLAG